MAYYSFGGWKDSLFGDKHIHGPEGVSLLHPRQVVTSRWPAWPTPRRSGGRTEASGSSFHFPTAPT